MSTRKNFLQRMTAMTIAATGLVIASNANGQELHNQASLDTGANAENGTAAPAGSHWSELQHDAGNTTQSNTILGFSASLDLTGTGVPTGGIRVADNFTVPPGQIWNLTGVSVFGYQTGASQAASPFDQLRFQIWRGNPANLASTVVFGDMTTNRLSTTVNITPFPLLRTGGTVVPAPAAPGTTRKLWRINGNAVISLGPGSYWLDYGVSTTNNGASFMPPTTVVGSRTQGGWNAIQFGGVQAAPEWVALLDTGNPAAAPDVPQDMPFIIQGTQGNGCLTALKPCPTDVAPPGGDGLINVQDLLVIIGTWGNPQVPPGAGPRQLGDVAPTPNGDCVVNTQDLLAVIGAWGSCPTPTGSCCLPNGTCQVLTQAACNAVSSNAVYNGDFTTCGAFCPVRPANDLCANALVATNGANNFSNLNSLTDGPAGAAGNTCEVNMVNDVWFNYTATATGAVDFNTVGSTGVTDTILAVYDTFNCPVTALLNCNDDIDGANNRLSRVILNLTSGQQVKIRVGRFPGTALGAGVLNIAFVGNDLCLGATTVAIPSVTNGAILSGNADPSPTCNLIAPGVGVWYRVVGNGNTLTAHTCNSAVTDLFDTSISVFCGTSCNDLNCVTAASPTCGPAINSSTVTWCSASGQTYWLLVHSPAAPAPPDNNFVLTITNGAPCGNPVACTCFTCTAGSQIEGEPCATAVPDTVNGGCNSTPAVFSTLVWVGNTARVCGTGSTFLNGTTQQRDTDWYVFTVAAAGTYTVSVDKARFTCLAGIVTNTALNITACGAGQAFVANSTVTTTGIACAGAALAAPVTLQPGTYALFAGASVFTGFPCSSALNDYQVTLTRSNP
jgi:hypothetical protein